MATRFCTSCGAPIQLGKEFCARCGAPVADASPTPDATTAQVTAPAGAPAPQAKQKLGTGTIVAIVAAVLLALALAFLIAWSASGNALPWQARGGQAQGVAGEKSEAAKSKADRKKAAEAKRKADAAAQAQRDAKKSATDAQFKAQILPYYNRLSDYDSRIASCATTFNSIYLSGDYAARSSAAQECYALEQSIQSDATSFSSIQAPEGSSYATQHAAIMRCLNDLQSRIACISNAWTTDLVYEDPAPYKEEILKPIANGKDPNTGKSIALEDYQKTYPTIKF
ncbi:zinc ribbon domain-containing protein [Parafannyhessea umbonata]|uniref:zinc ribbon domain-containing protein n=1 Tax=Parafannyhessea umbonata TaxID=604330 RepID=UPI002A8072C0|nr:zinc ribbon domain-containing protein [Parafannyhessea umbonata]MDY4014992.1 zinc ribbon domain-containing protein [Parafannyhessea umbonata]